MQLKFLIGVVLLGACLAQVSVAHPTNNEIDKGLIDDLIEKAKQLFEKIKTAVEEKVKEALAVLEKIKETVAQHVEEAIGSVKGKLEAIIAQAKEAIEKIKEKAEELGIDISECLKDNEDKFNNIVKDLLQGVASCAHEEIVGATKIINEAVEIVHEAAATVQNLPQKLQECISSSNPITCIRDLIASTVELGQDLPAKITEKIAEVQQFIAGLKGRLEVCAGKQLAAGGIAVGEVVAEVGKCAIGKQKMPEYVLSIK